MRWIATGASRGADSSSLVRDKAAATAREPQGEKCGANLPVTWRAGYRLLAVNDPGDGLEHGAFKLDEPVARYWLRNNHAQTRQ